VTDTSRTLSDHIERMGLTQARLNDPATQATVAITREVLRVAEVAMHDEGIEPEVIARVLRLIIYGTMPTAHDVTEKLQLREQLVDALSRTSHPTV